MQRLIDKLTIFFKKKSVCTDAFSKQRIQKKTGVKFLFLISYSLKALFDNVFTLKI